MTKVLPCPFCGSENIKLMNCGGWEVWCADCGGMGGTTDHSTGEGYATEDKCVANWNRRVAVKEPK